MSDKPQFLLAHEYGVKVCEALGLDPMKTQRIVIDIPVHGVVKVHVELLGTRELLNVVPLAGAVAIVTTAEPNEDKR